MGCWVGKDEKLSKNMILGEAPPGLVSGLQSPVVITPRLLPRGVFPGV